MEPSVPEVEFDFGDPGEEDGPEEPAEPEGRRVAFSVQPEEAVVTVYPAATEEAPEPAAIEPAEDGAYLLLPGEYVYSVAAKGCVPVEDIPFTVGDEPLTLTVALEASLPEGGGAEAPEGVPFERSAIVNGVVVTVKAEAGVFPAEAELAVDPVPVYTRTYRNADAAVDEVREEDQKIGRAHV